MTTRSMNATQDKDHASGCVLVELRAQAQYRLLAKAPASAVNCSPPREQANWINLSETEKT